LLIKAPARAVGAAGIYYQDEIHQDFGKSTDRFGEFYSLLWHPLKLHLNKKPVTLVPRNMCTWGSDTLDMRRPGVKYEFKSTFEPWDDEQARVVRESLQLLRQGQSFQLQAPTGFGKTMCMLDVIARVGVKTLVVVTKEDIKKQWEKQAGKILGLPPAKVGMIQGDVVRVAGCPLVIAMIQSVCKPGRYPEDLFKDFGLVIWDESQLASAEKFSGSAFQIPAKLRIGMSATPRRKDGREVVFEAHVGPVQVKTDLSYLTPTIIKTISPWKLPWRMNRNTGEMEPLDHAPKRDAHVIRMLVLNKPRNKLIVAFTMQAMARGRQIIIFSALRKHLEILKHSLLSAGAPISDIAYYVGGMTEKARDQAAKRPVLLATYKMAEYGTDIPTLDTAVLGTPRAGVEQIVGRIRRKLPGGQKKRPLVLDIVDGTSDLYSRYWGVRRTWYTKIEAEILTR